MLVELQLFKYSTNPDCNRSVGIFLSKNDDIFSILGKMDFCFPLPWWVSTDKSREGSYMKLFLLRIILLIPPTYSWVFYILASIYINEQKLNRPNKYYIVRFPKYSGNLLIKSLLCFDFSGVLSLQLAFLNADMSRSSREK